MIKAEAPDQPTDTTDAPERPFPLARRYRRGVLPIMALFVVSLVALTALSVRQAVREIHLEFAARRVAEIAAEAGEKAPAAWQALLSGSLDADQRKALATLFAETVSERGLSQLKVYSPAGEALFSTDAAEIGQVEDNTALTAAIKEGERVLLPHLEADGTRFNEFYIPLDGPNGAVALVMELYEPAGYLRSILVRALVLPVVVPGLLLLGLLIALGYLIRRAQAGIDLRAARVRELSARLESFMSSSAVGAVRAAPAGGDVPLKRIEVSLLFSDVRRFTEFSETETPEAVIAFLDRLMTLEIECVARHGGDVDKLIGDALLARFEGEGKEDARGPRRARHPGRGRGRGPAARRRHRRLYRACHLRPDRPGSAPRLHGDRRHGEHRLAAFERGGEGRDRRRIQRRWRKAARRPRASARPRRSR